VSAVAGVLIMVCYDSVLGKRYLVRFCKDSRYGKSFTASASTLIDQATHTDKKENKISLINKEIQRDRVQSHI
jgi:hypothetical protein